MTLLAFNALCELASQFFQPSGGEWLESQLLGPLPGRQASLMGSSREAMRPRVGLAQKRGMKRGIG